MSLTAHRVIQYIVIITLCAMAGGGYWYWKDQQAKASVVLKTATDTGLVAYWSFDEGSGTTAEDFSPANANTGTLTNGPTWVDGKVGKALSFDGTDDYVTMGDQASLEINNNSLAFGGWFYIDAYPAASNRMFLMTKGGVSGYEYELTVNEYASSSNKFTATLFTTTTATYITVVSNTVPPLNTWFHVMGVWDKDAVSLKIYYNGTLENTSTSTAGILHTTRTANFEVGRRSDNVEAKLNGLADEVRVYNRALSGTEITNLYQTSAKASMNTSENSDLTNGLVGLWSFNGADVSGTTAYDRSGNGNNGGISASGPTTAVGKIGQALDFDGNDDHVNMGDPASAVLDPTGSFSLSAWVKTTQTKGAADYAAIVGKGFLVAANGYGLFLDGDNSSKPAFQARTGATIVSARSSVSINDGAWHHLVGVRDHAGNITQLYVDGVLAGSGSGALTSYASTYYFGVGSRYNGSLWETFFFDGSVDEVRMYNRTLSATEIWNLYQAGGGAILNSPDLQIDALEQGLAGYWKLDDGSGTSATDASTNGNTGTLTNGPTWTTGQIGGAVSFDGTNDMIAITDSAVLDTGGVGSWCNWFYTDTNQSGVNTGFSHNTGGGTYAVIGSYLTSSSGALAGYVRIAGVAYSATTPVYSSGYWNGAWHHVCTTFDKNLSSGRLKLYVDGVIAGSNNAASGDIDAGITPVIGAWKNSGPFEYFNGDTDEVRVYTRALSAEEIAKLYQSTAPDNPDTGLKGYWSFNGPDVSGTTASDRSGQGNNGTLTNGPTVTTGKIGQALSFDGSNDYVSAGDVNAVDGASTVTLSGWFRRGASNAYLTVGKSVSGMRTFNINFYNDGRVYVNVGDGGVNSYGYFTSNDTDWHHVVFVFDGNLSGNANRAKAYLDGVQQSLTFNNTIPAATQASSDSFEIGRDVNLGTYSSGSIDEVRLYSRAFTQTEVTNLYNLGR